MFKIFKRNTVGIIDDTSFVDPRGLPQSLPVVITIFTQIVCPSVSTFQNQAEINCGLAEWIVDASCIIIYCFYYYSRDWHSSVFETVVFAHAINS